MARFREGKEWFIISFRSKVGRSAGDREVEEIESWGGREGIVRGIVCPINERKKRSSDHGSTITGFGLIIYCLPYCAIISFPRLASEPGGQAID